MEITIRPYEERDWASLVEFGNAVQSLLASLDPLQQRRYYQNGDESYTKWLMEEFKRDNGVVYMAFDGGKAVGHVAARMDPQTTEDLVFLVPSKQAFIDDLYVIEEYRSKGVGAKLLKRAEEHYKALGCNLMWLNAYSHNPRSLDFYDREGYSRQFVQYKKLL
jgi:GNAT superfamily N-acetyltransferase